MTLKIKDKNYFKELYLYNFNEKIRITGVFLRMKKLDPGDPKRPDPDPQHWLQVREEC